MAGPQTKVWTVNSASSAVANYQEIPLTYGEGPAGALQLGYQALGFRVLSDTATSGATLQVVFAHPDGTGAGAGVAEVWTATVTATSRRQAWANGTGYYVCDVVFTKSGNNFVDVGGCNDNTTGTESVKCYVGVPSLGSSASLYIEAWGTRNAG